MLQVEACNSRCSLPEYRARLTAKATVTRESHGYPPCTNRVLTTLLASSTGIMWIHHHMVNVTPALIGANTPIPSWSASPVRRVSVTCWLFMTGTRFPKKVLVTSSPFRSFPVHPAVYSTRPVRLRSASGGIRTTTSKPIRPDTAAAKGLESPGQFPGRATTSSAIPARAYNRWEQKDHKRWFPPKSHLPLCDGFWSVMLSIATLLRS